MCGESDLSDFHVIKGQNSLVLCKYLCYFADTLNVRQLFAGILRILTVCKPEERDAIRI